MAKKEEKGADSPELWSQTSLTHILLYQDGIQHLPFGWYDENLKGDMLKAQTWDSGDRGPLGFVLQAFHRELFLLDIPVFSLGIETSLLTFIPVSIPHCKDGSFPGGRGTGHSRVIWAPETLLRRS